MARSRKALAYCREINITFITIVILNDSHVCMKVYIVLSYQNFRSRAIFHIHFPDIIALTEMETFLFDCNLYQHFSWENEH